MYFKGPIHRRYLGSIRKLKWMTVALSKEALSLPSTHPWASERFHCIRRTPSPQREYKCKSKNALTPLKGPLFIEPIIICRLGGERLRITTGNWYTRGCLHVAMRGVGGEGGNKTASSPWRQKTCVRAQFCKRFFFFFFAENIDCRSL